MALAEVVESIKSDFSSFMLRVSMSDRLSVKSGVKSIAVLLPSASLCSKDTSLTTVTSNEFEDDDEEDDEEEDEEDDEDEEEDVADAALAGVVAQSMKELPVLVIIPWLTPSAKAKLISFHWSLDACKNDLI